MGIKPIKLKSPSLGGCKRRGNQKTRPEAALTRLNYSTLLQTLSNSSISAESKHQIMQRAVSNCPSVNLQLLGVELPSLLDSGSMVTLIREGFFFTKYILPKLQESQELSQAHSLFRLLAVNNGIMPVSHYFEADVNLLGFTVPRVGFLVVRDPNSLLTPPYATQLPGVIGCNLIQLGCEEFGKSPWVSALQQVYLPRNSTSSCIFTALYILPSGLTSREFNHHGYDKHQNRISLS